ncbi:MAG: glycosyltransferase family 2 protein [Leptothrix sp. (in: b-proteobacteria)]
MSGEAQALVTVVIAAYRSRPDHLHAAIASALAQTWSALEVVVSDDTPDDALAALVASFGDDRLVYRHNRPALGVARNHWACFEAARGEFVVVLNHDDQLEPTSVWRLALALKAEPRASLAFADHWVIDADGLRLQAETDHNSAAWGRATLAGGLHQPFLDLVARQSIPMAMGAMFRRAALTVACPPSAGPAYDLWLAYLLARDGGGAVYVPERLSAWRTHSSNLTSQGGLDWLLGSATAWEAMAGDPLAASVAPLARRHAARWFYVCARRADRAGDRQAARRHAQASWRSRPSWRGLFVLLASLRQARSPRDGCIT